MYIAYHDSTDPDVDSSGKLMAFSSLGSFEIESAQLDGSATTGNLIEGASVYANASGLLTDDSSSATKVGVCTGLVNLGVGGHTTSNVRGGAPGTIEEDATGTSSSGNLYAVTFVTGIIA